MTSVTRPRGPLPGRVYWTRRALVLLIAFGLVFGIGRLLGSGGGGSSESATNVGSTASGTPTQAPGVQGPAATDEESDKPGKKKKKKAWAKPDGPCDPSDVVVTPKVKDAHVGEATKITLLLTTRESPACTWEVSPTSVVLSITSGVDSIWTSQDCRRAVPTMEVVPRRKHADKVVVRWNGMRSDGTCSRTTDYAKPGWYHVAAVATGAVDPVDVQFELGGPVAAVQTRSPSPSPTPSKDAGGRGDDKSKQSDAKVDQNSR